MDENRRIITFALPTVVTLGFTLTRPARAESVPDLPEELAKDAYVNALVQLITSWNESRIKLNSRSKIRPLLKDSVEKHVQNPTFFYETADWVTKSMTAYDALPETVVPKLPLSGLAASILISLYSINLLSVKKQYQTPQFVDQGGTVEQQMEKAVFIVFGGAQERAFTQDRNQIEADDIIDTIFAFWSTCWPFSVWKNS